MRIKIAKDFTETPGGRDREQGPFSGEEFREDILEKNFIKAEQLDEKLFVDFDGAYGYPPSFLEESFGILAEAYGRERVLKTLIFECKDEPNVLVRLETYINQAEDRRKKQESKK